MSKIKIFNDPIYGLINFSFESIYELIDHPYFQRLRRICQIGMSSYVYPGATHTRFHHAIGATYLSDMLLAQLKLKGISISKEEHEACLIATLLHDIGHGPFSHALEYTLMPLHHEQITLRVMHRLNDIFKGKLSLAIEMFEDKYHRTFFKQILSSQLDVDRMDYLNRDSYYTGVAEGIIGYQRLIKMMNVFDGRLVVEQKGLHSVEKFIISRHLMYHQVYLHKTCISAEQMLKLLVKRYKEVASESPPSTLHHLLFHHNKTSESSLDLFLDIDDNDILYLIKICRFHSDIMLKYLANSLINRNLFKSEISDQPFDKAHIRQVKRDTINLLGWSAYLIEKIVTFGSEENILYSHTDEIYLFAKDHKSTVTFSSLTRLKYRYDATMHHFLSYPYMGLH